MKVILRSRNVIMIMITVILLGCSKQIHFSNSNLYVVESTDQQLVLQIESVGKNEAEAYYNGEIKVINTLMFHGIPNTFYKLPLVNEVEKVSLENHSNYYNDFYNRNYKNFIVRSQVLSSFKKNGILTLKIEVVINVNALRRDLENNNVLRKFGL